MPPTDLLLLLLRRHIEAVWTLTVPPLQPDGDAELSADAPAPWALYLALVAGTEVRLWRHGRTSDRRVFLDRARTALADPHLTHTAPDVKREVVLRRDRAVLPSAGLARRLDEADRDLLEAFEPGETAYWLDPRRAPLFGVVRDGRLLSIAHSSRRTAHACELGINTLPAARRRGFARACVSAWAHAVTAEGLEPLYSADRANVASLALAGACGYRAFAQAAQVPASGDRE